MSTKAESGPAPNRSIDPWSRNVVVVPERSTAIDEDLGDDGPLTDDELTVLALAADPDAAPDPDAVALWSLEPAMEPGGLPHWYMPAPAAARPERGWRRWVVYVIIAAFVAIAASGLCSTYGEIVIA